MSFIKDVLSGIETVLTSLGAETNRPKVPENDIIAGDVKILDISLVSLDGNKKVSLVDHAKGIQIFKSLMSPVIFAELNISDSVRILEDFPILTGIYVGLTIQTPNTETPLKLLFRVNDILDYQVHENLKNVTYTLQLVSPDMMRNSKTFISKSYKGDADELIKSILNENLETPKDINLEKTSGIVAQKLTKETPFRAIDFIRKKTYSLQYPYSRLYFFECKTGYRLASLARLMDEGAKRIEKGTDKEFFFDTTRKVNVESVTIRNILAYNRPNAGDRCTMLGLGGLTNAANWIDILVGEQKAYTYTDNIGSDKDKTASGKDAAALNSTFATKLDGNSKTAPGNNTSASRGIPVSSALPITQYPQSLSAGIGEALKVDQNKVMIFVYGDTDIDVGDMIICHLPSASSIDDDKPKSRLYAGNYLVSKIRHIILNGDRPQHAMSLELIKGDLGDN
jgi:hypothetical protein